MSSSDPHILAALDAARQHIAGAAAAAATDAVAALRALAASTSQRDRGGILQAQTRLLGSREALLSAFDAALRENIAEDIAPDDGDRAFHDPTDWKAVGLVGDEQIEEQLAFERVGQLISHDCEAELREVAAYTGEMLDVGWGDPARNPLRGNIVGASLTAAIDKISDDAQVRRCLVKELGQALATKLPPAYRAIVDDFASRGFGQADLAVRMTPSSPAPAAAGSATGLEAMRELWERSMLGRMPAGAGGEPGAAGFVPAGVGAGSAQAGGFAGPGGAGIATSASTLEGSAIFLARLMQEAQGRPMTDAFGILPPIDVGAPAASTGGTSDAELMQLLRRLNSSLEAGLGARTRFDATASTGRARPAPDASGQRELADRGDAGIDTDAPGRGEPFATSHGDARIAPRDTESPATNLIRTHREELEKASTGQLDHMVIEVVASLFDQIFSDPRVAPQIAREIARLQLPVLRVALRDTTFFAARKHPVRRFINRISTLAGSFGELDHGPGRDLLARVHALVSEIVDGDFDQIPVYARKLVELEAFNSELVRAEFEATPAAETLHAKENEWRVSRQFGGRLQEAIEPLPVAAYLKTFLGDVWSQVIVVAAQDGAADPAREQRFRRAAFDLVASVQPKRTAEHRAQFITGLRGLTATLNEGLAAIGWPKEEHDAFFAQLMNDQAGSLKATPGSELDHNLLLRRLDAVARTPLPAADDAATSLPGASGEALRFSAGEAKRVGLLDDDAVDWSKPATDDASACGVAAVHVRDAAGSAGVSSAASASIELDLDLATRPAPLDAPAVATAGAALPVAPRFAQGDAAMPSTTPAAPTSTAVASVPTVTATTAPAADAEPTEGPALRHHLQIGVSYQLRLKEDWEKVRLTYMSPGRSLFLFAHGSGDRGTISMTSRMLERLCEARRIKAFETSPLFDRATERLGQQPPSPPADVAPSTPMAMPVPA